jgi:protein tyrosine phosphatase (PTP) superfamily phosphohydrolase (DUF442 family)
VDISSITHYLWVGAQPKAEDADALRQLGVRLVISMRGEVRPPSEFSRPPLSVLWLRTFDYFFTPIPMNKLMRGVQAALPVIQEGGQVLTHCKQGRHRGVAMGAAILIAMGHTAEEAMSIICRQRESAHPQVWYVRRQILKFEKHWRRRSQAAAHN